MLALLSFNGCFFYKSFAILIYCNSQERTHYIPLYVLADKSILQKQREQTLQGDENNVSYTTLSQTVCLSVPHKVTLQTICYLKTLRESLKRSQREAEREHIDGY